MAETKPLTPSPFGPKGYVSPEESARIRSNRANAFAESILSAIRGGVKAVTTDLPGFVMDIADKIAGDTKTLGEKDRSEQMFSAVTGTSKKNEQAELVGSFVNPIALTQAMILPAFLSKELKTVKQAAKLKDAGVPDEVLFKELGIFGGPNANEDGVLRTFLSDQGAKLKYSTELDDTGVGRRQSTYIVPGAVMGPDQLMSAPWGSKAVLSDILDHPELFALDPSLKNIRVGPSMGYKGAFYNSGQDYIGIGADSRPTDFLSTLLHEIQHGVQARYNMVGGGNPNMFFADASKIDAAEGPLLEAFKKAGARLGPVADALKSPIYTPSDKLKATKEYQDWALLGASLDKIRETKNQAYENYRLLGGEVEAFGTEQMFKTGSTNPLEIYPKDGIFVPEGVAQMKPLDKNPVIEAILRFVETQQRAKLPKDTK